MKTFISRLLAVPFIALFVTSCFNTSSGTSSLSDGLVYTTLEINPGIGLMVNEENRITYAHALNADGEMVLLQLQLEGKSIESAIDDIVGEVVDLKFVTQATSNAVTRLDALGSVTASQANIRSIVQTRIGNSFLGEMITMQTQTRTYSESEIAEAALHGTTPLKYRLMMQAMMGDNNLLEEELVELTNEALLEKAKNGATNMKKIAATLGQDFLNMRQLIQDEYLPLIHDLQDQIAAAIAASEDTSSLTAALNALRAEMVAEIQLLVADFRQQTAQARVQWQAEAENRRGGLTSGSQTSNIPTSTGNN
jgi:hypothetical protein